MRILTVRRYLLAQAIVTIAGFTLLGLPNFKSLRECEEASTWVARHRDSLPTTAEEFLAFSPTYRRYIFGSLSPADKSKLFRESLSPLLGRSDLSPSQKSVLADVYESATPEMYASAMTKRQTVPSSMEVRLAAEFPAPQLESLLPLTRQSVRSYKHPWPVYLDLKRRALNTVAEMSTAHAEFCNCITDTYCVEECFETMVVILGNPAAAGLFCNWYAQCGLEQETCTETLSCGPFGTWECHWQCSWAGEW
jgi:hypothetical protein